MSCPVPQCAARGYERGRAEAASAKHEEQFAQVMRKYVIRRFIRPGLTGWAQVSGFRGEIHSDGDIQKRVEADIHYLENWSFSLDCLIILKTGKHCVFPPRRPIEPLGWWAAAGQVSNDGKVAVQMVGGLRWEDPIAGRGR